MVVDGAGNLILSTGNRVRVVAVSTGTFYGQAMTAGDIYTIAGSRTGGFSGDGGPATAARLNGPGGLALDGAGNVLVADAGNNRVRVVAVSTGTFYGQAMTAGDIYTIAGSGAEGASGDGGPATAAALNNPGGLTLDAAGNLLIADTVNGRIRAVAEQAGTFYGQPMTPGDIYTIVGGGSGALGDGGPATKATLSFPEAVTISAAGTLLIADTLDRRIRQVAGAAPVGTWGNAENVPGMAALSHGGAVTESVSCASAGNCSAGGQYESTSGRSQAFVVTETNSTWGNAEEVPGTAILNKDGNAVVESVSCVSAGNCVAGGQYGFNPPQRPKQAPAGGPAPGRAALPHGRPSFTPSPGQAFVVTQTNGTWGKATAVPGSAALNAGGDAMVTSVSCVSPGDCGAGGFYTTGGQAEEAFVATEANGTWGTAQKVPGLAGLNTGDGAAISSLSCTSAGNCSAGGQYQTANPFTGEAFVVTETGGVWGSAEKIPGTAGWAGINSLSCTSAGNCGSGGESNAQITTGGKAIVASESNGTWGSAEQVPGTAVLNAGGDALISAVSCTSAGNCSAGGYYTDAAGHQQALIVNEVNGVWGSAEEVPGTAALNAGGTAAISSLSCAAAGNCSAGGYYTDASGRGQVFVAGETNGTWGGAEEIPGTAALNTGPYDEINSVSCATADHCSAGGYYWNSDSEQAFVITET